MNGDPRSTGQDRLADGDGDGDDDTMTGSQSAPRRWQAAMLKTRHTVLPQELNVGQTRLPDRDKISNVGTMPFDWYPPKKFTAGVEKIQCPQGRRRRHNLFTVAFGMQGELDDNYG